MIFGYAKQASRFDVLLKVTGDTFICMGCSFGKGRALYLVQGDHESRGKPDRVMRTQATSWKPNMGVW